MSKWQWYTIIFTISVGIAVGAYDVVAMFQGGYESSISYLMITWAYKFPIFPFFMGVLCGHLFWRMPEVIGEKK